MIDKQRKFLYLINIFVIFILGFVAAINLTHGSANSYFAMVGSIFIAMAISYIFLKILFSSKFNESGDKLTFSELTDAKNEKDVKNNH